MPYKHVVVKMVLRALIISYYYTQPAKAVKKKAAG